MWTKSDYKQLRTLPRKLAKKFSLDVDKVAARPMWNMLAHMTRELIRSLL